MATELPRTVLRKAILAAFKPESLTQLFSENLNRDLTDLVPANAAFDTQVFELIDRGDDEGWLGDLIDATLKAREGNATFVAAVRPIADKIQAEGLASAMGPRVFLNGETDARKLEQLGRSTSNRLDKPWWIIIAAAALTAVGTTLIGGIPSLLVWIQSFYPIDATLFLSVKDAQRHRPMTGVRFSVIDTRNNALLRLRDADGDVAVSEDGFAHLRVRVMRGLGYAIEASYASDGETFTTTIPVAIDGDLQKEIMFDRTQWYTANQSAEIELSPATIEQASGVPTWMKIASTEIGQKETGTPPGNPRILEYLKVVGAPMQETTPWDSAFVNWVMKTAGYSNTGSPSARSWLNWGVPVDPPTPGCIAVFWRGSPTGAIGHVGFYWGEAGDGSMAVLGGNQFNAVSIAKISKSRLLGCRVPS